MADADVSGVAPVAGRPSPTVGPFGDSSLLVTLGDRAEPAATGLAHRVAAAIDGIRAETRALGRPIPAHASVLVPFDPVELDRDVAIRTVRATVAAVIAGAVRAEREGSDAPPPARAADAPSSVEIPVRYGGLDGPDLAEVAERVGMTPDEVVACHAGAEYRVLFLGFAPGFAYLGGLPRRLDLPRRSSPRERVPAGSVAIAGGNTAIYPLAMPGGWHLIGRTEVVLFDPDRPSPALLEPGTTIRFVPAR